MAFFRVVLVALTATAASSAEAPAQCRTAITLTGLGVQGGVNFDADYYWSQNAYKYNRYEAVIMDDWWGMLAVGCQPHCNTPEQTAMAQGKWALVRSGNNVHFGDNELLAVCVDNCPPVSDQGPPGFVPPSNASRWAKFGGGEAELHADCCKRKADVCDSCDEGSCRAQTVLNWAGIPDGCKASASSCCWNNHDETPYGHCGCKPVETVCDHGATFITV